MRSQSVWDLTDVINLVHSSIVEENLGEVKECDLKGQIENIVIVCNLFLCWPKILYPLIQMFSDISHPQRIILKINYK